MHSVANLVTLQTPLVTLFPSKKAPKPYLVSDNRWYCRASSCFPSARTHTHLSLSLCVCSVSVLRAHTHTSLSLSLCICSVSVLRAHTHTSLSLSASAQFLFFARTHTHLSLYLCASAQFLFCAHTHTPLSLSVHLLSFCSARTHTHLSISLHLLSFCSACGREEQRFNSVKHRYYVACFFNFTCKYSGNHSTAIVFMLCVFDFIRRWLNYQDFCVSWKRELISDPSLNGSCFSHYFIFIPLSDNRNS